MKDKMIEAMSNDYHEILMDHYTIGMMESKYDHFDRFKQFPNMWCVDANTLNYWWTNNANSIRKPLPDPKPVKIKKIIPHTIVVDDDRSSGHHHACGSCLKPICLGYSYCPYCGQKLFEEVECDEGRDG